LAFRIQGRVLPFDPAKVLDRLAPVQAKNLKRADILLLEGIDWEHSDLILIKNADQGIRINEQRGVEIISTADSLGLMFSECAHEFNCECEFEGATQKISFYSLEPFWAPSFLL
jgi:hypothetical protein